MQSIVIKVFESNNSVRYTTSINAMHYDLVTDYSTSRISAVEELLVSHDIAAKGLVEIRDIHVQQESGTHTELIVYACYFPALVNVFIRAVRDQFAYIFQVDIDAGHYHYSSSHPLRAIDLARMSLKTHFPGVMDFNIALSNKDADKMPSEIDIGEYSNVHMVARAFI